MSPLEISQTQLRQLTDRIAELALDYLSSLDDRPVFPGSHRRQTEKLFRGARPEKGKGRAVLADLDHVVRHSRAQNGRFFGYVMGSAEPVSAITELLASVLNQNATAWRSSPAAVTLERTVVEWLAGAIGCRGFRGSLTSGGSLANLMGLAMAREAKAPANRKGRSGHAHPVVYASEQVHMSIPKSVAVLGIGIENLRLIKVGKSFRMEPAHLEAAIRADKRAGKLPIAVVASAGTVNTGSIDPLREIAAIARRHGLWLHVDGAYGALAAMAVPDKFRGLKQADSISLDPHKWLYQPLDCGCLLYRDPQAAQRAFSHTGDYAKSLSLDPIEGFAFFEESLELSRRFRALKLWLSLRYHGFAAFRDAIRKDLRMAQRLAKAVEDHPELELLAPVELSAVCFRYRGSPKQSVKEENRQNTEILQQVVARGRVYLSNATLGGKFALRACIVNHRTRESDVDTIVPEVLFVAKRVR